MKLRITHTYGYYETEIPEEIGQDEFVKLIEKLKDIQRFLGIKIEKLKKNAVRNPNRVVPLYTEVKEIKPEDLFEEIKDYVPQRKARRKKNEK